MLFKVSRDVFEYSNLVDIFYLIFIIWYYKNRYMLFNFLVWYFVKIYRVSNV